MALTEVTKEFKLARMLLMELGYLNDKYNDESPTDLFFNN